MVLDGEATFETLEGEVTVKSGEAVRFVPGEFQSGQNGGDGELVLLGLGATLAESEALVVVRRDCEKTFERPPLRD